MNSLNDLDDLFPLTEVRDALNRQLLSIVMNADDIDEMKNDYFIIYTMLKAVNKKINNQKKEDIDA